MKPKIKKPLIKDLARELQSIVEKHAEESLLHLNKERETFETVLLNLQKSKVILLRYKLLIFC